MLKPIKLEEAAAVQLKPAAEIRPAETRPISGAAAQAEDSSTHVGRVKVLGSNNYTLSKAQLAYMHSTMESLYHDGLDSPEKRFMAGLLRAFVNAAPVDDTPAPSKLLCRAELGGVKRTAAKRVVTKSKTRREKEKKHKEHNKKHHHNHNDDGDGENRAVAAAAVALHAGASLEPGEGNKEKTDRFYIVERILGKRNRPHPTTGAKMPYYHVKWLHYKKTTWEPSENLREEHVAVKQYHARLMKRRDRDRKRKLETMNDAEAGVPVKKSPPAENGGVIGIVETSLASDREVEKEKKKEEGEAELEAIKTNDCVF